MNWIKLLIFFAWIYKSNCSTCQNNGRFLDTSVEGCRGYIFCGSSTEHGIRITLKFLCPEGLTFNEATSKCSNNTIHDCSIKRDEITIERMLVFDEYITTEKTTDYNTTESTEYVDIENSTEEVEYEYTYDDNNIYYYDDTLNNETTEVVDYININNFTETVMDTTTNIFTEITTDKYQTIVSDNESIETSTIIHNELLTPDIDTTVYYNEITTEYYTLPFEEDEEIKNIETTQNMSIEYVDEETTPITFSVNITSYDDDYDHYDYDEETENSTIDDTTELYSASFNYNQDVNNNTIKLKDTHIDDLLIVYESTTETYVNEETTPITLAINISSFENTEDYDNYEYEEESETSTYVKNKNDKQETTTNAHSFETIDQYTIDEYVDEDSTPITLTVNISSYSNEDYDNYEYDKEGEDQPESSNYVILDENNIIESSEETDNKTNILNIMDSTTIDDNISTFLPSSTKSSIFKLDNITTNQEVTTIENIFPVTTIKEIITNITDSVFADDISSQVDNIIEENATTTQKYTIFKPVPIFSDYADLVIDNIITTSTPITINDETVVSIPLIDSTTETLANVSKSTETTIISTDTFTTQNDKITTTSTFINTTNTPFTSSNNNTPLEINTANSTIADSSTVIFTTKHDSVTVTNELTITLSTSTSDNRNTTINDIMNITNTTDEISSNFSTTPQSTIVLSNISIPLTTTASSTGNIPSTITVPTINITSLTTSIPSSSTVVPITTVSSTSMTSSTSSVPLTSTDPSTSGVSYLSTVSTGSDTVLITTVPSTSTVSQIYSTTTVSTATAVPLTTTVTSTTTDPSTTTFSPTTTVLSTTIAPSSTTSLSTSTIPSSISLTTTVYSTTKAPFGCFTSGRFPDTNVLNCKGYILCLGNVEGQFTQFNFICPTDTVFNPYILKCTSSGNCNSNQFSTIEVKTPATFSAPISFECSVSGRFPDPSSTNCSNYFLCVKTPNEEFAQYTFSCPPLTSFDPTLGKCSESYTCSETTIKTTSTTTTVTTTTTTTPKPTTTTLQRTIPLTKTKTKSKPDTCIYSGRFPDESSLDCSGYILCTTLENGSHTSFKVNCPKNTYFDPVLLSCNINYVCKKNIVNVERAINIPVIDLSNFDCQHFGRFVDYSNTECTSYILCQNTSDHTFIKYRFECLNSLKFDPKLQQCSNSVDCDAVLNGLDDSVYYNDDDVPELKTDVIEDGMGCTREGRFRLKDDSDCKTYMNCVKLPGGSFENYYYTCAENLFFDPVINACSPTYVCPINK